MVKTLVTLFWALVIGQVVGYIMTALSSVPDPEYWTVGISLAFGLFVLFVRAIALPKTEKEAGGSK